MLLRFTKEVINYPLWHVTAYGLWRIVKEEASAAALATALFQAGAFLSVLFFLKLQKTTVGTLHILAALVLLIVNPIYLPLFNSNYYLGQSLPNIWHNPTNIAVKLFAVSAFGLTAYIWKEGITLKRGILLSLILFFSGLAKPSFLQAMLPAVFLFFLIRVVVEKKGTLKRGLKKAVLLSCCFLPALVLTLLQFFRIFISHDFVRESRFGIGFGKMLYQWTPSMLVSFVISFAFPLAVFLSDYKRLVRKPEIQLMLCLECAAWTEAAFLYEKGDAFLQGNFTWAYSLSAFLAFLPVVSHKLLINGLAR